MIGADPGSREEQLRQYARNVLSGGGRYAVAALLALVVTPYTLSVLGDERFGVWALGGAVFATLRLLDLGLNRSLMRAVAEASGKSEPEPAMSAMATARGLSVLIAAGMALLVWQLAEPIVAHLFLIPEELTAEAVYVVAGTALVAGIERVFSPFQAGLDGVGRMDLTNGVDTVQRVLSAVGVIVVLSAGWGLEGLIWKNLLTVLLAGLAYRFLLRRKDPQLAASGFWIDRARASELLSFGKHVQVVNLGALLIEPVSKVLLSRFVGLDAVALFELAVRVVGQVGGAFMALATALFPAAAGERSAAGADGGDAAVARLYSAAAKYLTWLAVPAYGLLIVLAEPFVAVWLGPDYGAVALGIAIMGVGWLPAVLSTPGFVMAQAAGHERIGTVASIVTAGVGLAAAALLVRSFGLVGVYVGVALGWGLGGIVLLIALAQTYKLGRHALPGLSFGLVLATGTSAVVGRVIADNVGSGLIGIALAGSIALLVYAALMLLTGAADRQELLRLRRLLGAAPEGPEVCS